MTNPGDPKKRTSISISEESLVAGTQRSVALGYPSFSAYIEFLILKDAHERRPHYVRRDEGKSSYTTGMDSFAATDPAYLKFLAQMQSDAAAAEEHVKRQQVKYRSDIRSDSPTRLNDHEDHEDDSDPEPVGG